MEIKSSHFIHFNCLENGVTMTPKLRLLTLIFACLCFKKSLLIKTLITITMRIIIIVIFFFKKIK